MAVCRDCGVVDDKKIGWRGRRCRQCVAAAERNRYRSKNGKSKTTVAQNEKGTEQKDNSVAVHIKSESDLLHYVDDGCSISNSCFECPLPLCRYDGKEGKIEYQKYIKNIKKGNLKIALIK